jgi:hypothetical protein
MLRIKTLIVGEIDSHKQGGAISSVMSVWAKDSVLFNGVKPA